MTDTVLTGPADAGAEHMGAPGAAAPAAVSQGQDGLNTGSAPEADETAAGALRLPGDDASPEDWRDFYGLLGRPDAPGDYKFKMPDGLAEDFPYEAESAQRFAEWAHEAGLTPRQAQSLHDRFVQDMNGRFAAGAESDDGAVDIAHDALIKAWGEPSSEAYRRNVDLANRALRELGGGALEQAFKDRGVITANGEITEAAVAFMLQKAGARLYAEDEVFGGNQAPARNPFAGEGENITEQGRVLRSDPELARSFIRAAGREREFPRLFGGEF